VALLRSFQRKERADTLQVEFADFSIAHILMDSVISESLHGEGGQTLETAQCIRKLMDTTGEAVRIEQVQEAIGIPYKRAAERIQHSQEAGLIRQANSPEIRNVKRFVATSPQQLLPEPKALFQKLRLSTPCSYHHPLTGELVVYAPETAETRKLVVLLSDNWSGASVNPHASNEVPKCAVDVAETPECVLSATEQAAPIPSSEYLDFFYPHSIDQPTGAVTSDAVFPDAGSLEESGLPRSKPPQNCGGCGYLHGDIRRKQLEHPDWSDKQLAKECRTTITVVRQALTRFGRKKEEAS
jgi:hypothetical protein